MSADSTPATLTTSRQIIRVAETDDPLAVICQQLLDRGRPPDLNNQTILTPDPASTSGIQRRLLALADKAGYSALLGPRILPLGQWLNDLVILPDEVLHPSRLELLIVEALQQQPSWCGHSESWQLAQSLIPLFDEITREHIVLPEQLERFKSVLQLGYQLPDTVPEGFSQEAKIVHMLWRGWQQQQAACGYIDAATAYTRQLTASAGRLPAAHHVYLLGFRHLTAVELAWLSTLLNSGHATLVVQGLLSDRLETFVSSVLNGQEGPPRNGANNGTPVTPAQNRSTTEFLNLVFAGLGGRTTDINLAERMTRYGNRTGESPVASHIKITSAANAEQHARIIELQLRLWQAEGHQSIGIICEDRRLSRRLRALLERRGLSLHDQAGWALSTTSAATVLERLLQSVEEDFDQSALLDLLKSPFLLPEQPREDRLQAVFWLERDIIRHENIQRGLSRYRTHIRYRQKRLAWHDNRHGQTINELLDIVERSCAPLRDCQQRDSATPAQFLAALQHALSGLGIDQSFGLDAAGIAIAETLDRLSSVIRVCDMPLTWNDFRYWFGHILEQATFRPLTDQPAFHLMTLDQAALQQFDSVIIAGMESQQMPGQAITSPFFNNRVRHELGLGTQQQYERIRLGHFLGLLLSAQQVVLTWQCRLDDRETAPSPWLELLDSGHRLAFGQSLHDSSLATWSDRSTIEEPAAPAAAAIMQMPAPAVAADLLPEQYSASSYQRLVDCPYRFYAADCLGLKAAEEIQQALEKSDYGERVHRILQAFHENIDGLPGPFNEPLNANNRAAAQECLEKISRAMFSADLEKNALHHGWLQRWQEQIPAYLDWEIERQRLWRVDRLEQQLSTDLVSGGITIKGRIDRLDRNNDGCAVVDYKTGKAASQLDVENGESVQLPFYALLHGQVQRAEYLVLDNHHHAGAELEQEVLASLAAATAERLQITDGEMRQGRPLPAWGDSATCSRCDMNGVCRRGLWDQS